MPTYRLHVTECIRYHSEIEMNARTEEDAENYLLDHHHEFQYDWDYGETAGFDVTKVTQVRRKTTKRKGQIE